MAAASLSGLLVVFWWPRPPPRTWYELPNVFHWRTVAYRMVPAGTRSAVRPSWADSGSSNRPVCSSTDPRCTVTSCNDPSLHRADDRCLSYRYSLIRRRSHTVCPRSRADRCT
uniref:Putative secreted protein n=1 Tax=Anopheles darlingi TaxID=43151 RepID=A0A2M4D3V3_ANODA